MAILGESVDIGASLGGKHERDGSENARRQSPAAQDEMDEGASRPAVSIHERMDGLELCVRDRGLGDCGKLVGVAEGAQVVEEPRDVLGRRGNVRGRAGVVVAAADPVLGLAYPPRIGIEMCSPQQAAVNLEQQIHCDLLARPARSTP